jgi:hypothetical protein
MENDESGAGLDLSFLVQQDCGTSDTSMFIRDVKEKVARMHQLELAVVLAEAALKDAKQACDTYKATVVVAAFTSAGITSIQDDQGNSVKLKPEYYCNPNKNDDDRKKLAVWLEKNGGGHLLKHEGRVSVDQYASLEEAGIPFVDKREVNTNSLKSYLIDLLGYKEGGQARISLGDIPEHVHFVVDHKIITE